jgi:tetratricopeptide (TPR) repeat protein
MSTQTFTTVEDHSPQVVPSTPPPAIALTFLILLSAIITWSLTRDRPNQSLQWLSQGKDLERTQQYQQAIALYDQGIAHYPNDYRLWHERGLALAKLQQFEAAIASYDRAYQIRPTQRDLSHERGDAPLQLKRYEEAIASFDTYLRYAPNVAHILADKGYALFQLHRYKEALSSLNQALKVGHQDPFSIRYAHYYQIETLRHLGQLEAALISSQIATQKHPNERLKTQQTELHQQMSKTF